MSSSVGERLLGWSPLGGGSPGNAVVLVLAGLVLFLVVVQLQKRSRNLPPGPVAWPIFGSMFLMSSIPHRTYEALAKIYGPIMSITLGSRRIVVVSNADLAKQVLKVHDADLSSERPDIIAGKYFSFDYNDIIFSSGAQSKFLRKICTTELLSASRLRTFGGIRREEMASMVLAIHDNVQKGAEVKVRPTLTGATSHIMVRMLMGARFKGADEESRRIYERFINYAVVDIPALLGKLNIADLIPGLRWFDLQGIEKQLKEIRPVIEKIFELIIEEHRQNRDAQGSTGTQDIIDVLFSMVETKDLPDKAIMGILMNMMGAGADTSAASGEWALGELCRHPHIMKRLQSEIDTVVGTSRRVEESDLPNLPYLIAVCKEILRLHPPATILSSRISASPMTIAGYHVPEKTMLLVNVWAISHDPTHWKDPLTFDPERFLRADVNPFGSDYHFLPFGSGRRGCAGAQMGFAALQYLLAAAVQAFDWNFPGSPSAQELKDIDMMESFGLTAPRTIPLVLEAKTRLSLQQLGYTS